MADRLGYQCEFVECVPEHFLCSKCKGVARRLTFTSCCGESYCHGCITEIQQKGEPCPACEEKAFITSEQVKFQRRIRSLQVYCSMKERGCDWTGTLDNLDAHLDPDGDNCQHVDTKCPFDCQLNVPKNKLNEHVEKECSKRPYTCQHCGFKGTHEEVSNVHLPECKYVPLQCPNRCGVTCDREDMGDHLKMCRLEEIACEFSGVGCKDKFARELEAEHVQNNSQSHLSSTAAALVRENLLLQQKLLDQKQMFEGKLEDQEKKLLKQDKLLQAQERKIHDQQKLLLDQGRAIQHHDEELREFREKQQEYMATSSQIQQKKLHEQERKLEDQVNNLELQWNNMLQNQARKLQDQARRIDDRTNELQGQEKRLQGQEKKQLEHENKMQEMKKKMEDVEEKQLSGNKELRQEFQEQMVSDKHKSQEEIQKMQNQQQMIKAMFEDLSLVQEKQVSLLQNKLTQHDLSLGLTRRFVMANFSKLKKEKVWRSPDMYSRMCGYKFNVVVYPSGCRVIHKTHLCMELAAVDGEFDDQLIYPVTAHITIELLNREGGSKALHKIRKCWKISHGLETFREFLNKTCDLSLPFDEVKHLLLNDALEFNVLRMEFNAA